MKISSGFVGERYVALPHDVEERLANNPLHNALYIFAMGHFPHATYHNIQRPNGCNEDILLYCTSGEGHVTIDGKDHPITADTYIVIPANTPHAYWSNDDDPWSIYWIHYKGRLADAITSGMTTPQTLPSTADSRMAERIELFDEIYAVMNSALCTESYVYTSLLLGHLMATFKFLDVYRSAKDPESGALGSHSDTIVRIAIHYMNEHLERQLTMDELASLCRYSKSHLHRKFIKEVGMAPMDYFIHQKIERACLLLTHTTLTVSQISMKLAFSESQYFARTFKKIMGMSATEYRKAQKN